MFAFFLFFFSYLFSSPFNSLACYTFTFYLSLYWLYLYLYLYLIYHHICLTVIVYFFSYHNFLYSFRFSRFLCFIFTFSFAFRFRQFFRLHFVYFVNLLSSFRPTLLCNIYPLNSSIFHHLLRSLLFHSRSLLPRCNKLI